MFLNGLLLLRRVNISIKEKYWQHRRHSFSMKFTSVPNISVLEKYGAYKSKPLQYAKSVAEPSVMITFSRLKIHIIVKKTDYMPSNMRQVMSIIS
jgi:hypothetical protein